MSTSLEDRKGRKGVRFSGFSTPALMTSESRARKWVREAHVSIDCQLGLKGMSSQMHNITNRTHVEDVKHPEKVLLPSGNLVLVSLREDKSGECVSFASLDHLPLNLGYGSAIETSARNARCQSGSRSQTPNRFEDGLIEVIQILPFQSSVECLAYSSTIPPELDVILVGVNQKFSSAE